MLLTGVRQIDFPTLLRPTMVSLQALLAFIVPSHADGNTPTNGLYLHVHPSGLRERFSKTQVPDLATLSGHAMQRGMLYGLTLKIGTVS